MELFETSDHYIVLDGDYSLWCNRQDGRLAAKKGSDLASAWNPICLGEIYGIIGKISINPGLEKLLVIAKRSLVGRFTGGQEVYAINKIAVLPLSKKETPDLEIEFCKKHHFGIKKAEKIPVHTETASKGLPLQKTWNTIKTATEKVKAKKHKDGKDRDKFEKRVTDELVKMFNDTESFYYSHTVDLTNSMQRQCEQQKKRNGGRGPLWKSVDDRFFWNAHMMKEIIESGDSQSDHWIVPIIQGFLQIQKCMWDPEEDTFHSEANKNETQKGNGKKSRPLNIIIVSRRSRYRAGTRYRRRGVDESGKVANYVETEQIVEYEKHTLSFVQVRGSVPVYWSQPGYKYRPPPRLDRGEEETQVAFEKHFDEELTIYSSQAIVSLVEQTGKEKVIADAYLNHILNYNSPNLTYITFDFHEYCRGMRFENVSVLILSIQDVIRDTMYCWMDKEGIICEQKSTFRVNCIDCLDRTNVVQTALAKAVLEIQFTKLGVVPPEGTLSFDIRNTLQIMWANNGDSLSRQYAGTAALKGDYTRTGERRLTGMMKDGYNSANRYFTSLFRDLYRQASISLMLGEGLTDDIIEEAEQLESYLQWTLPQSLTDNCITYNDLPFGAETHLITASVALSRYYLNRFKDASRQASIDIMLGHTVSEEDLGLSPDRENADDDHSFILTQSEHIKQLIEDCKKILVPDTEVIMGGWALIDADPVTGDPSEQDADTILILTRDSYYIADYDNETDRITNYHRVLLQDIEKIELGPEPSLFKSKYHCIRLNYVTSGQSGYFHMFRSTNVRFFNNMAIIIKSEDEALESLKAICDTLMIALEIISHKVPLCQGKLERKRSKTLYPEGRGPNPFRGIYLDIPSLANIPRNVSEGQLLALKNAGSKALSNVTSQFAKLNPMSLRSSLRKQHKDVTSKEAPSTSRAQFHVASSSESDEETAEQTEVNATAHDVLLESCGILATGQGLRTSVVLQSSDDNDDDADVPRRVFDSSGCFEGVEAKTEAKKSLHLDITSESADIKTRVQKTPEIHISQEEDMTSTELTNKTSSSLQPPFRKLSHSSDTVSTSAGTTSDSLNLDPGLSMKTSHSDGAINKDFHQAATSSSSSPLTSPMAIPKDLVLTPLTKLAKGVHNIGMNFQRAAGRHHRQPPMVIDEQLRDRCQQCRTRIIQL